MSGTDGQTALVIDGDEHLLTETEMTKLVPKLPDGEGENWYKPPPEMPGSGAPVNVDAPYVSQSGN